MSKDIRTFIKTLVVLCFLSGPVAAYVGPWVQDSEASWRLIWGMAKSGEQHFGLEAELKEGWHIYWRSPGDAGLPPELIVTGGNLVLKEMFWPTPIRFDSLGIISAGYKDKVVFPLVFSQQGEGNPKLQLQLSYLICKDICLPKTLDLSLIIPGNAQEDRTRIKAAYKKIPLEASQSRAALEGAPLFGPAQTKKTDSYSLGVGSLDARSLDIGKSYQLYGRFISQIPLQDADIFVEDKQGRWYFTPPKLSFSRDKRTLDFELSVSKAWPFEGRLDEEELIFTLASQTLKLYQVSQPVQGEVSHKKGFWFSILGIALLGGIILNFMPCVLPVLAIKLTAVLDYREQGLTQVRLSFFMTALGIVATFWFFALLAVLLQVLGLSLGWGLQFQEPRFALVMALLIALFAANLWGLFAFQLPFADKIPLAQGGVSLGKAFLTGVFATLLATPCTAPFVGTALSFALTRGALEILLIFTALGLGLALPYWLVAAFPGVVKLLPRPGKWMLWLKQIMGGMLILTLLWLLSLTNAQLGGLFALFAAVVIALGLWFIKRGGAFFALVFLLLLPLLPFDPQPWFQKQSDWQQWEESKVEQAIQKGKVSFVDVTARWCVTCQSNKRLVLDTTQTQNLFSKYDIQRFRADWTKPDPLIKSFLERYQRFGIPFNLVYGPGAPQGIILPEILTYNTVKAAIKQAALD